MRIAGICLQPFVPRAAGKLLDALYVPQGKRNWKDAKEGVGEREVVDVRGVMRGAGTRFFEV
jgi:methionyl-tRNA synthetase